MEAKKNLRCFPTRGLFTSPASASLTWGTAKSMIKDPGGIIALRQAGNPPVLWRFGGHFCGKIIGKKNTQKRSCFLCENHEKLKGNCEYSYVENYCSCVKFRLSHEILFGSERFSILPGNPLKSPSLSNPMKSHLTVDHILNPIEIPWKTHKIPYPNISQ